MMNREQIQTNHEQVQKILDLLPFKTAIIGMAKNAGKTVVFNSLIEVGSQNGLIFGVTSAGRDGEGEDALTKTGKPLIYLPKNTYFATAANWLLEAELEFDPMEETEIDTYFGKISICKVTKGGHVEISGGNTNEDHDHIIKILEKLGCDKILIDGAMDRQAITSPKIVNACILATGAVLGRDMEDVIRKTNNRLIQLSVDQVPHWLKREYTSHQGQERFGIIQGHHKKIEWLPIKDTGLEHIGDISNDINPKTRWLIVKGALTSRMIESLILSRKAVAGMTFVVEDASKLFLEGDDLLRYEKRGLSFLAINKLEVIAVTLNPISPQGHKFDPHLFLEVGKKNLQTTTVVDVLIEEAH